MAFVRGTAGWFPAKTLGRAGAGMAPPPQASLGQRAPPLRYQARIKGSLGSCPGTRKPSLPPRGLHVFPWTTLPSRSPIPPEAECPGKTWGPGARAGGPATVPRQVERAGLTGPMPTDRFSCPDSGLGPAQAAKSLALAQTAPSCPEAANFNPAASTL